VVTNLNSLAVPELSVALKSIGAMEALAAPTTNERRVITGETITDIASRPGPEIEMRCEFF